MTAAGSLRLAVSRTEDCPADADHCRALVYGNRKVRGHSHRQLLEIIRTHTILEELIAYLAEAAVIGSGIFRVVAVWRHAHQPAPVQIVRLHHRLNYFVQLAFIGPEFGLFVGQVELYEYPLSPPGLSGPFIQFPDQSSTVDRMDQVTETNQIFGLVALEVPDEMPAHLWQILHVKELLVFVDHLLGVVLSQVNGTGLYRLDYRRDLASLRDGHEPHIVRAAAGFVGAAVLRLGLYTTYDTDERSTAGVQTTLAATILMAGLLAGAAPWTTPPASS